MGMDRNTLIGFVLIGALLIAMFAINSKNRLAYEGDQKRITDSIAKIIKYKADANLDKKDSTKVDSLISVAVSGGFQSGNNQELFSVVENEVMKVTFTNKGGQPKSVELKKYKKFNNAPVMLNEGKFNKISYRINATQNHSDDIENITFKSLPIIINADNSKTISFQTGDTLGRKIIHQYTIRPNDYMLDFNILVDGANDVFTQNAVHFIWQSEAAPIEKDHAYELTQSHFCFLEDNNFDFEYLGKQDNKNFTKSVSWIGVKQQFFAMALIAKNKFSSVSTSWMIPVDTSNHYLSRVTTMAQYNLPAGYKANIPLELYFGPSDYNILKQYNNGLENIVPYGSGIFSFVKYINRYFLLPVFDFIQRNIASMGIVILLLTLLIRLITSPILYKSYLSGAKMKVLKPEVDALRAKYKDDQQTFGMEQMKLWKSAGVSPLGGCLPALLQIPIFMSLYYFFQSNIDLRGKSFLWAKDLAAYDSIAKIPFEIPFYGDHVSLFTLTAVITSLLISLYSMNSMQDNNNPLMKYMPYIFPVLLLGVFNKLPSALTWYYTISNTITLILQIVIQKYIIDHDKIMKEMTENRKKPVKKSKMQERIEAMQQSQKKIQEMKSKGK